MRTFEKLAKLTIQIRITLFDLGHDHMRIPQNVPVRPPWHQNERDKKLWQLYLSWTAYFSLFVRHGGSASSGITLSG